jgi:hypothetical protein
MELEGNYRVRKSLPLVPILCQTYPVYILLSYFFKIYVKSILSPSHTSPKWSLPIRLSEKNNMHFSSLHAKESIWSSKPLHFLKMYFTD